MKQCLLQNVMSNSGGGHVRFVLGFSAAIDSQRVVEDNDNKVASRGSRGNGEDVDQQRGITQ